MSETKSTFKAKLIAIVASIALAMSMVVCVQPAHADTTFQNTVSTTSVQVILPNSSTVQTVNFSSAATSATTHNAHKYTNSKIGAMFYKEGYQVIGADSYVTLQDVITAAGGDNSWSYVKFYVYNSKDGSYATYTKYNSGVFNRLSGTYAGMSVSLPFYGETDASGLDTTDPSYYYTSGAVLALNGASGSVSGTATAGDVLDGITTFTSSTAPRLMWGYDTVSNNEAGNRFPSNIVGITVYQ